MRRRLTLALASLLLGACRAENAVPAAVGANAASTRAVAAPAPAAFAIAEIASFDEPWALAVLPDGALLVTEKRGRLKLVRPGGAPVEISGVPEVAYGGQGGLGDVVLHPRFADTGWIYLSYAEPGERGTRGAAVARARLVRDAGDGGRLEALQVVWRQQPKDDGGGHYGHRIAFDREGLMFISSGDRQLMEPAQSLSGNLGKILRLRDDGSLPPDNPFADRGGVAAQVWTLGHRNVLGLAFDANGQLWAHEMGPRGGDELNRIEKGANYGYPIVSNGDHYNGKSIPDHDTRPQFRAPVAFWNPVISPAGLVFYRGDLFPAWKGDAFIGGLSSESLVRIEFDGDSAREAQRFDMGRRIREVEQGPDGALWLLGDGSDGPLLKLTPQ